MWQHRHLQMHLQKLFFSKIEVFLSDPILKNHQSCLQALDKKGGGYGDCKTEKKWERIKIYRRSNRYSCLWTSGMEQHNPRFLWVLFFFSLKSFWIMSDCCMHYSACISLCSADYQENPVALLHRWVETRGKGTKQGEDVEDEWCVSHRDITHTSVTMVGFQIEI